MSSHYLTCNNKYCHASLDKPSTSVIDSQLMSPHCFLFAHWEALCDFPSLFLLLHAVKTNPCWYRRNLGEQERETCFRIFWIIQENTLNSYLLLRYLWGLAELLLSDWYSTGIFFFFFKRFPFPYESVLNIFILLRYCYN